MKLSKLQVFGCVFCVLLAGCARIADPKPPEHRVPEIVRDLEARQNGEEIVLTFSVPERNTDGSPARTIRSLEIFRIAEKAEAEIPAFFDDLSEERFLDRAAHAFSVPAARFPEYMRGNVFVIRDAPPKAPGASIYSLRFRYAAVFVNEKNQAAGLGRQAVVQPVVLPPAPEGLAAVVTENEIRIAWTPAPENTDDARQFRIAYNIYRSEKPDEFPAVPVNGAPLQAAEYADRDFQFDKNYYYTVSIVVISNSPAESGRSEVLKVEARDIFPPAPPESFIAIAENGSVTLFWTPSPSADVAGYRIFRENRIKDLEGAGSRRSLREELITGISYRDESAEPGGDYIYEIQAVDGHGNASTVISGQ
ncbi:MAG: hypothetical protein FWF13_03225 [Acidobacteria bacterium]|nr:hypothetical protein [Acidobacteriota bacterium]